MRRARTEAFKVREAPPSLRYAKNNIKRGLGENGFGQEKACLSNILTNRDFPSCAERCSRLCPRSEADIASDYGSKPFNTRHRVIWRPGVRVPAGISSIGECSSIFLDFFPDP